MALQPLGGAVADVAATVGFDRQVGQFARKIILPFGLVREYPIVPRDDVIRIVALDRVIDLVEQQVRVAFGGLVGGSEPLAGNARAIAYAEFEAHAQHLVGIFALVVAGSAVHRARLWRPPPT